MKCWTAPEPFDWNGKYWKGKGIVSLPRPLVSPHMPMATATDHEAMLDWAGANGYYLLTAQLEPPGSIRRKADRYVRAAKAAGRDMPLNNIVASRYVYLADSHREAIDDLRPAITTELRFQMKRGFLRVIKANYGLSIPGDEVTFDQLAETGIYYIGDPDTVARQLREFYEASGGFGKLLIIAGKNWATREKVFRSMRMFMDHVAPKLRDLEPVRDPDSVAA